MGSLYIRETRYGGIQLCASAYISFHQGVDNFVHRTDFFLGGKIPREKKEEVSEISERKEQNASYF